MPEKSPVNEKVTSEERHSIYSPVPNRESFIERKIRLLEEQDNAADGGETGRPSLDCLGIVPKFSRVAQE